MHTMKFSGRREPILRPRAGSVATAASLSLVMVGGALVFTPPGIAYAQEETPGNPAPVITPGQETQPPPAPTTTQEVRTGRLRFIVLHAETRLPIQGAQVVLADPLGILNEIPLPPTDAEGVTTTEAVEARGWRASVTALTYAPHTQAVAVIADETTDVTVEMRPSGRIIDEYTGRVLIINPRQTTTVYRRDPEFLRRFPILGANRFNLAGALRSIPGAIGGILNQVHVRGERDAAGTFIDGFLVQGLLQPHIGDFLLPHVFSDINVMPAGTRPEHGGVSGVALDLVPRTAAGVSPRPFAEANLSAGGFLTSLADVTFGAQAGDRMPGFGDEPAMQRFGFLVSLARRRSDNFQEPASGEFQRANNTGISEVAYGRFDYLLSPRDRISLTTNYAPSTVTLGNRTPLEADFAPFGQGYGHAGALSQSQAAFSGNPLILDQQTRGREVFQKEDNGFSILTYDRRFDERTTGRLSLGIQYARHDEGHRNPPTQLGPNNTLPAQDSIEYDTALNRDYSSGQIQARFARSGDRHSIEAGGMFMSIGATEFYTLIPRSQQALGDLQNFAPGGAGMVLPDGRISGVKSTRDGYYASVYAQDTWFVNDRVTILYGPRIEFYSQEYDIQNEIRRLDRQSVKKTEISPRVNVSYLLGPLTVVRGSYSNLFSIPSIWQGSTLAQPGLAPNTFVVTPVRPERVEQYDIGIERQITREHGGQVARLSIFNKTIRDQFDLRNISPGTQSQIFLAGPSRQAVVDGVELMYDYNPRLIRAEPLAGYLAYTYMSNRQKGNRFQGVRLPVEYLDFDQRHTLTGGVSYRLRSGGANFAGSTVGLTFVYNSGMVSSLREQNYLTTLRRGSRVSRTELNLRLATSPTLLGGGVGFVVDVENLTNARDLMAFRSPVTGTHFQQGRRLLLTVSGRF